MEGQTSAFVLTGESALIVYKLVPTVDPIGTKNALLLLSFRIGHSQATNRPGPSSCPQKTNGVPRPPIRAGPALLQAFHPIAPRG